MIVARLLLFIFSQILLAGCFFNSAITNLDPLPSTSSSFSKVAALENVSGSTNYTKTAVSGYLIKHTAGLVINKQMTQTPNGYRVYLNVSGRITSAELNR